MKLKDLLSEVKVQENNFVKVDMVKDELKQIFGEDAPKTMFDEDGLYIKLDNFQLRDLDNTPMSTFSITDTGFENDKDEAKAIKKYYIEYVKTEKTEFPPEMEDETSGDTETTEET